MPTKNVGPDGRRVIPTKVALAIFRGDKEALSEMGTNGNHVKQRKRHLARVRETNEAIHAEYCIGKLKEELRARDEEANLHICPID
ncbi:MAG: hypothetical protein NUW00_01800 [Candidatus Kaiserbacteria bacterium]|nr:hypothetical protein [Candidatus Kaiserbacteria bacterium]